jgi:hypothetical protein
MPMTTWPQIVTECQFNPGVWSDISPWTRGISIKRGSSRVESPILRYEPGTCTLRLDNRDRRFDPTNLAGPYVADYAADTGVHNFTCSRVQPYAHGVTVDVRSLAGQNATVGAVTSAASGTTGSFTVPRPPGTVNGSVLVAFHSADVGTPASMSAAGGSAWTSLGTITSGVDALQTRVWIKTAGGSEPANYTFGQSSGADGVAAVVRLDAATLSPSPVWASATLADVSVVATPATTPGGANDVELRWAAGAWSSAGATWNGPTGFTKRADRQSGSYTTGCLATRDLSGFGQGSGTRVLPMRPIRVRAVFPFTPVTNRIHNPSFETGTAGWAAVGSSSIEATSERSRWGGQSLQISRVAASPPFQIYGAACSALTGPTSGTTVTVTAYVYVPAASRPKISAIAVAATGISSTFLPLSGLVADSWHRISLTTTLTATLGNLQIQFWTDDSHSDGQVVAYLDGVQVETGAAASPYCDGSQPACSWSGTAHASTSSRPSSFTFDLFRGFVDQWDISWEANVDSEVNVPCTDAFKVLAAHSRTPVAPVGAGENSGARVTRILNSVGWPVADRDIAAGNSTLQATTLEGEALSELQLVADSENGELYVRGDGKIVFRNRQAVLSDTRSTLPQARFGDGGPGQGELPYHEVGISYDDAQLANVVRIAAAGGAVQEASDAASIAEYLTRTFERTDLLFQSNAEALSYAQWVLWNAKDPELRFDTITVRPQKNPDDLFPQVLGREIGDRIVARKRPPGGGDQVEREVFVRGISHEIGQRFWETTWTLQSASKVGAFWTLGHPQLGRVDSNALVY